ncbi:substrate-binding periplasmic protein [Piscirickettsia litoralis]|uniref:Solute-binding protein family 3/N-terminal domain-containing protein n=1 Tax=Piscirickettsia litoralis TaxID=1891921 RepID=A0ABX3A327_9GAMM|nr:transporter substrate-binding domain-containing protein [Piscirickettsia litoralis]ODN43279.1 hypothetical protein BGC07_10560 [Piscirickettsia litoralis]
MFKLLVILFLSGFMSSTLATISKITVVTGEWPPYTSQTVTGYGLTASTMIHALSSQGVSVEFKWLPWKRAFLEAKEAKYDGTIPWFKTPGREKEFYFSLPIGFSDTVIWYSKSNPVYFSNLSDLTGKRLGGTIGYSYGEKFDLASKDKFTYDLARSDLINLKKLLIGRIDAFPCDKEVCKDLIENFLTREEASKLTFATASLVSIPTYFLVSKKHKNAKEILYRVNEGLKLINKSKAMDSTF